jgi:hypothetical protein
MSARKYTLPKFLDGTVSIEVYDKWLSRKAKAHFDRDRKRGYVDISAALYKEKIHDAVLRSYGKDKYTGEMLNWSLISTYDNEKSKEGKHSYKASFAYLPTVDHVETLYHGSGFCICGWRTNDMKHDLSHGDLIDLCLKIVEYSGYKILRDERDCD